MAQPEHLAVYAATDTYFTFPRDPEGNVYHAEDMARFAAVRLAKRDGINVDAATDFAAIAEVFSTSLANGTATVVVCPN